MDARQLTCCLGYAYRLSHKQGFEFEQVVKHLLSALQALRHHEFQLQTPFHVQEDQVVSGRRVVSIYDALGFLTESYAAVSDRGKSRNQISSGVLSRDFAVQTDGEFLDESLQQTIEHTIRSQLDGLTQGLTKQLQETSERMAAQQRRLDELEGNISHRVPSAAPPDQNLGWQEFSSHSVFPASSSATVGRDTETDDRRLFPRTALQYSAQASTQTKQQRREARQRELETLAIRSREAFK